MDWIYTLLTFKLFQAKKNAYDSAKAHEKSEDSNKSAKAKTEKDINKVSGYMAQLLAPKPYRTGFRRDAVNCTCI